MQLLQRWAAPLLLLLCTACVVSQVLIRPAVGIANNNDFAKLAGALHLEPADGSWTTHKQYGEFLYQYIYDDRYEYNSNWSSAEYLSSEYFLLRLARGLQEIFRPGPRFDIRWLGAVNSLFYLFAIGVWIYAIPLRWRLLAGLPLVLIWTDAAYVQYMNSFYMDSAALIFLILFVGAGLHVARNPESRAFPVLTMLAGLLFVGSKTQHALPGLILVPLFLWLAFSTRDRFRRATWLSGSVLLVLVALLLVSRTTQQYRSVPLFSVIFWRLAPATPNPLETLQELGLGAKDLPYLHTHAYFPNSPISDPEWAREFAERSTYGKLLHYYLRHPSTPAHFVYTDLSQMAPQIRPYANRSRDDGFALDAQSRHFTLWTNFRSSLISHAPWHLLLLSLLILMSATRQFANSPVDRLFAALVVAIQILALSELGISSLADTNETDRHLFLFHVATEISILLLPALLIRIRRAATNNRTSEAPTLAAIPADSVR